VRTCGAAYRVIGKASNVVFSDEGFAGLVIFTGRCDAVTLRDKTVTAAAGIGMTELSRVAQSAGLAGLEFAYGIPGTVGGAVVMNAGAYGGCMADVCISSRCFDMQTGEILTYTGDAQGFAVRTSVYEKNPHLVVLEATMRLTLDDPAQIDARMREYMERRRASQPLQYPSAGSVFKRPVGYYAGKLIEDCGLKGLTVGGAQVSEKHAGFIVNRGGATARDVWDLSELVRRSVKERFGVDLEREIKFL